MSNGLALAWRGCSPQVHCWASRLALRRCVLPLQLWGRAVEPLLLHLQPCLPTPGTLQVVAHMEPQPAQALGLDLDQISILEGAQATMVGPRSHDIARLQGM